MSLEHALYIPCCGKVGQLYVPHLPQLLVSECEEEPTRMGIAGCAMKGISLLRSCGIFCVFGMVMVCYQPTTLKAVSRFIALWISFFHLTLGIM